MFLADFLFGDGHSAQFFAATAFLGSNSRTWEQTVAAGIDMALMSHCPPITRATNGSRRLVLLLELRVRCGQLPLGNLKLRINVF